MQRDIHQTWFFQQPPGEVWEYLTKPELIEQWLGQTDFQPIVGHKFRLTSPYGNHSYCEVLEIKPFVKLSYSWQKNSASDKKPFHSKVTWTLVPKDNGTELQLLHDGFVALEDTTAHNEGWNICLNKMIEHINSSSNVHTNP
jgi:uncharacterized protein YndB with AHSA1/START domain